MEVWKDIYHVNTNQKDAEVTILISCSSEQETLSEIKK
jgi:hypothetical protein